MNMKNILTLIHFLIKNRGAKFSLTSINERSDELFIIFKEIQTGKIFQQKAMILLNKPHILKQFTSADACKIGYTYGKHQVYKERLQNDNKIECLSDGTHIYNN